MAMIHYVDLDFPKLKKIQIIKVIQTVQFTQSVSSPKLNQTIKPANCQNWNVLYLKPAY